MGKTIMFTKSLPAAAKELLDLRCCAMGVVTWRKGERLATIKYRRNKSIIYGLWEDAEGIYVCQCDEDDKYNSELFADLFEDWLINTLDKNVLLEKYQNRFKNENLRPLRKAD